MLNNFLLSESAKKTLKFSFGLRVINTKRKHVFWKKKLHFFADIINIFITYLCSSYYMVCQISCKNNFSGIMEWRGIISTRDYGSILSHTKDLKIGNPSTQADVQLESEIDGKRGCLVGR